MAPVRPRRSPLASGSGPEMPSSRARARILSRRSAESWSGLPKAFETVTRETPNSSASVLSVTRGTALLVCSRLPRGA